MPGSLVGGTEPCLKERTPTHAIEPARLHPRIMGGVVACRWILRKGDRRWCPVGGGGSGRAVVGHPPWSSWYYRLGAITVGPEQLHLHLTLAGWATDGLLAIFFFVVGVELKREFVAGDLRDPGRAALPIVAAVGGMLVPAAIYLAVNASGGGAAMRGWAIPTATDIAFALAVLAVISTHLPTALRTFCSPWRWWTICWRSS